MPYDEAKTVVFLGDGGYGIAVLPCNTHVDLELLADSLGLTQLRLATEEELLALFPDVELGAMPAFGNLYGVPFYLHMMTGDFIRLSDALLTRFARKC